MSEERTTSVTMYFDEWRHLIDLLNAELDCHPSESANASRARSIIAHIENQTSVRSLGEICHKAQGDCEECPEEKACLDGGA